MRKVAVILSVLIFSAVGCATAVPITSTINDNITTATKTNIKDTIAFTLSSDVVDGLYLRTTSTVDPDHTELIVPAKKNDSGAGYTMNPNAVFKTMITEYMNNKFSKIDNSSKTSVSIKFSKIELSNSLVESKADAVKAAMIGGEIQSILKAKIVMDVTILLNGKSIEKRIISSSETTFTQGIGTHTETSNVYRGENTINSVMGRNINSAMNKAIASLNSFFTESQL